MEKFIREIALIGKDAFDKLSNAKVAVFGVGGVGGFVCEGLARAGIKSIAVIDNDCVNESNFNRQIIATTSNLGKSKVDAIKERIADINPSAIVKTYKEFYLPDNCDFIDLAEYDYVVDAVDTVTAKLLIIEKSKRAGVKVISCLGTGNKLNPFAFSIADIEKTTVCPLARVMRRELKKRDINGVKVLYSTEVPVVKEQTPASISFVPSVAGLLIASEVIMDLTKN